MGKHERPIITPIADNIPIPERKSRGTKPFTDDEYIREAIKGIKDGTYKTVYAAAKVTATKITEDNLDKFESTRKRISRKIKKQLICP